MGHAEVINNGTDGVRSEFFISLSRSLSVYIYIIYIYRERERERERETALEMDTMKVLHAWML